MLNLSQTGDGEVTKYEFRREVRRLCAEANKTIGMWRVLGNKLLGLFVIGLGLLPVFLWAFFVYAIVHFILKAW
jgi:hypothetical protein